MPAINSFAGRFDRQDRHAPLLHTLQNKAGGLNHPLNRPSYIGCCLPS